MLRNITIIAIVFLLTLGGLVFYFFFDELDLNKGKTGVSEKIEKESAIPPVYTGSETSQAPKEDDYLTFTGTVQTMQRPAPDIAYDYILTLDTPYHDPFDSYDEKSVTKKYPLVPDSEKVLAMLKGFVNKRASVSGYIRWGYAETRHFEVYEITQVSAAD